MSTQIVERQDTSVAIPMNESATILQVIQRAATDPQCDIDKMERLMQMHERFMVKQAEQLFAEALAGMQNELPSISERGDANGRYKYALWEDINETLKPVLAKHGFALSFRTRTENGVEVQGVLTHKAGHSERTTITLPADPSGNKNAVQAVASSISYGKRYTAGALLNFTSHGEDDDAFAAGQANNDLREAALADLLKRVAEAVDAESLTRVWQSGVGVLQAAKDMDGYNQLKQAVSKRGAEIKGDEQ